MPVSYDHIGRDIIIVAVMFLLVFVVLLLCWFFRFTWQSLTRRWLRRRRFGTDVHNLPFPIQEQPQEAWMSKISQESNVYLVKTTYIINPVIKSCDGNNGFILINQLDCLKKQMSTYHLFFITYQLFICTLFD